MEFEDLSEEVQHEARRVAAAFETLGIVQRGKTLSTAIFTFQGRRADRLLIVWTVGYSTAHWLWIGVGANHKNQCSIHDRVWLDVINGESQYAIFSKPCFHEEMARGLYRLGLEDDSVFERLNCPLSVHEKLELRLSMPREFWPKTWPNE